MNWLQQNQPEFAASFLPGLTNEQIQVILQDLPYQLPKEIYELYSWRNGTRERQKILFHLSMAFLPLQDALLVAKETIDIHEGTDNELRFEGQRLFPFLDDEGDRCAVVASEEKTLSSPIILIDEIDEICLGYTSLTSMMQTIAECCQTGAYYLIEEGFIEQDEDKSAEILRKYNGEILEREDY